MSASRHSYGRQKEPLYLGYEDQDFIMYPAQGSQGDLSDCRSLDMNISLHNSPVHRERRYRSSHASGYSYPRSQRDDSASYSDRSIPRSRNSLEVVSFDPNSKRGRKSKTKDERSLMQRSWAETPALPRPGTPEFSEPAKLSSSPRTREKTERFSEKVYLSTGQPERASGAVVRRRDSLRGQSGDYLTRVSGNGDTTDGLHQYGRHSNPLPKRFHAGEGQRGHLPPAPMIPRLPTPDFESTSSYELRHSKYEFCACCHSSDDRYEADDVRWMKGKAKMEKQVDNARAYISRMAMGDRLIADA
ncbi:hypothetical protein F5B22DRAFT_284019 [Xylaria bambusicola]|uniref:uncharacterized protein n=1 Tax=Xylaria bambusicola TaxID=326684 RepID=UPI0020073CCC|nr:uncharacterized protein F5B22DRAFT_284019 [Xylaria bambusicola]KAI0513029.1 hypothetical protein F5B22DRAFT_284019 [Xylaria bambusicola]